MQIYVETSPQKQANKVPKLPGIDYVVKNWALAMMLPLAHFSVVLLLKEQVIISAPAPPQKKKMLKMLVRLMQNRLIFSNICREYSHEIRRILLIVSQRSLSRKIP